MSKKQRLQPRRGTVQTVEPIVVQRPTLEASNATQGHYIKALKAGGQTIVLGPSGTGKTYCAAAHAATLYLERKVNKIIITRPAVSVGKSLGSIPGDLKEKFDPWTAELHKVMSSFMGKVTYAEAVRAGHIVSAPLEYMRGSSYDDAFILVDEAQNLTPQEFKMVITRVGRNTSIVLNGDVRQSDLKGSSGLDLAISLAKKYDISVNLVEFTEDDIVRSGICKEWVVAFNREGV